MESEATTTQALLEDRIFNLELALLNIAGAMLAPAGWEDDQRLHSHVYDTVKRALRGSSFGGALDTREHQLQKREHVQVVPRSAPPSSPTGNGQPTRLATPGI